MKQGLIETSLGNNVPVMLEALHIPEHTGTTVILS
jgi:hypothetical protein